MSWFEEQLRHREESDDAGFEDAIDSIAAAVMGTRLREALSQDEIACSAIEEILKCYHLKAKTDELPAQIKTVEEQIEYRMRPFNIMSRSVTLDEGWYHHAVGAMLGTLKEDGSAVALIPGKLKGYTLINIKTGKVVRLNRKTEKLIDKEAFCFYEPFPQKALTNRDLFRYMIRQLNISDIVFYYVMMGCSTALGLLSPMMTKWLFSDVIESGSMRMLISLAVFMMSYSISILFFNTFRSLMNSRISTKQKIAVEAAVMGRIVSLPPAFFKQYSASEVLARSDYVSSLCFTLFNTICMTGVASLLSFVYIGQIFVFAPSLVVPSLLITAATLTFSLIISFAQRKIVQEAMEQSVKTGSLTYSTITGIQKIKSSGAEKRMFSRWAREYAKMAQFQYNPPMFLKINGTISLIISLAGTIIMYAVAIKSHVAVADYYAFNTAYSMVSGSFASLSSIIITVVDIKPTLKMAKTLMEAEPELHEEKEFVNKLKGSIELSHVSFRYDEEMPYVIDDLSLKIAPEEYVAIVGPTGCGKSTLMRLLLGFETPQKGMITYDNKEITRLDLQSLRRQIGSVMQDAKLLPADIYSNIVLTAPQLSLEEAWEAAEIAAVAEDIRQMPMGMNTLITEGSGGISGGQKQRLMIARAIAPNPKILIFDEATSALDNVAQKKMSDAIDSMKCTRIIIAHRLSTIRHADRIIYLDDGKIIEDGTYEELIAKNGYFAELVERQRLEIVTGECHRDDSD